MLVGLVISMFVTMLALPPLIRWSRSSGQLALPDARKVHSQPMPQIGGLAIFAGFVVAGVAFLSPIPGFWPYLGAATMVLLLGFYDDIRELDYRVKFTVQILAGLLAVSAIDVSGTWIFGSEQIPLVSVLLGIVFLVGVTNAVNLADGLDGLAAGIVLISSIALGALAFRADQLLPVALLIPLAGGLFGFLRFNSHPARIFMGDCGAYFIGFTLAFACLELCSSSIELNLAAGMMILGVPIYDTLSVSIRRLLNGRNPFTPDRNHLHHRLQNLGLSHDQVVQVMYFIHTAMVACGFAMAGVETLAVWGAYVCMLVVIEVALMVLAGRSIPSLRYGRLAGRVSWARTSLVRYLVLAIPIFSLTTQALPRTDFSIIAGAFALLVLMNGWVLGNANSRQAWNWMDRVALYSLGAYVTYFLNAEHWLAAVEVLELFLFVIPALAVALEAMRGKNDGFRLTAHDVLVLLVVAGLSLVGESEWNVNGISLVKLMIWFYAVEALILPSRIVRTTRVVMLVSYAGIAATIFMV